MKTRLSFVATVIFTCSSFMVFGQGDGFLVKEGKRLFPIGWYTMPKEEASLKELVDAGINFINCSSRKELDRAYALGIQGWMPIKLQNGVTDDLKAKVLSVADHPALAIWEGPDEIVWNFTATSGLVRSKVHEKLGDWWEQTSGAINYADKKAKEVMPKMIEAINYLRSVDPLNRQIWINEAASSDAAYVHEYIDHIDITGCDDYPVRENRNHGNADPRSCIGNIGFFTERWKMVGMGKPVWMVLQAFSWPELEGQQTAWPVAYPSFDESRYMAYTAIVHGARGILYWGGSYVKSKAFTQSIYAVTSELAALQPFLSAPDEIYPSVKIINTIPVENQTSTVVDVNYWPVNLKVPVSAQQSQQVLSIARRYGRDWMIVVVNETDSYQMGVVIENLKYLNGMKLVELYGNEKVTVSNEKLVLRMKPREVKVFVTGEKWETSRTNGRDYPGW